MTTTIKEILKARNVINQDLRKISSEDWFRSQPANIKANTIASQLLHQAIIAKNPNSASRFKDIGIPRLSVRLI